MLGARGPDLLAVDDVVVALTPRRGAQGQRVGAGSRLRHAEGLQAQRAIGDLRQIALLLLGIAVPQDGTHRVHLRMAGGTVAPRSVHLLQNRRGGADGEPATAVFFRDQRGEIAGLGQSGNEFGRISALAVERAPVFAGEFGAERAHTLADVGVRIGVGMGLGHGQSLARARVAVMPRARTTLLPSRASAISAFTRVFDALCARPIRHSLSIGHSVWVPAFAGTTAHYPHTSSATSTIMRSFAHCSSSAKVLPSSVEAKPHCGDRQS